jgi:hypothetical protein
VPASSPEPQAEAVSRLGDLWHLGDHRLICADACDKAAYARPIGRHAVISVSDYAHPQRLIGAPSEAPIPDHFQIPASPA